MKDTVLILTNSLDGEHTDSVISNLRKRGKNFFRFDTDKISTGEVKINFSAGVSGFGFSIDSNGEILDSDNIFSVWYRRPNEFNLQIKDTAQKELAQIELGGFLEGLWLSTSESYWLNNPHSLTRARRKILQLKIARELHFRMPETIVTNDPKRVGEFFAKCNGKIIFKTIEQEFFNSSGKKFNIPTTLITAGHLEKIDMITGSPSLFQEYIEKNHELRVTVIKNKIFAAKIYSQENPLTTVDWRNPKTVDKLRYESTDLPEHAISFCFSMMKSLSLEFGAFDFAVDKSGDLVFLEINPNGQWYWLEYFCKFPISKSISEALIN